MNIICALVVGHRLSKKGARNSELFSSKNNLNFYDFDDFNLYLQQRIEEENLTVTEYDFNDILARLVLKYIKYTQVEVIYRDDHKKGYENLPQKINELKPHFVVSLHANTFDKKASGTQMLYEKNSQHSKEIAKIFQQEIEDFLEFPSRGIREISKDEIGAHLLYKTDAPAIICEPFFLDNNYELAKALNSYEDLAKIYAKAIDRVSKEIFIGIKPSKQKAKDLPSKIQQVLNQENELKNQDENLDDLIKKLLSKDKKIVEDISFFEAVEKLAQDKDKKTIKKLIKLLDHDDEEVILLAIFTLRLIAQNKEILAITGGDFPKHIEAFIPKEQIDHLKTQWKEWFLRYEDEF